MDDRETAWLIEHPRLPLWLGVSSCGSVDWVGASWAIRFARKDDAERMARFFAATGMAGKATEHMWTNPASTHAFVPCNGNPFVCDECGYAEHVELKHGPHDATR